MEFAEFRVVNLVPGVKCNKLKDDAQKVPRQIRQLHVQSFLYRLVGIESGHPLLINLHKKWYESLLNSNNFTIRMFKRT